MKAKKLTGVIPRVGTQQGAFRPGVEIAADFVGLYLGPVARFTATAHDL